MFAAATLAVTSAGYISSNIHHGNDGGYNVHHEPHAYAHIPKTLFSPASEVSHAYSSIENVPVSHKSLHYESPISDGHYGVATAGQVAEYTKAIYPSSKTYTSIAPAYIKHQEDYPTPVKTTVYSSPIHETAYVSAPTYNKAIQYSAPQYASYAPEHHVDYNGYAHAATQQKLVHGYDGTLSHYAKQVSTPFSSVSKYDTRLTKDNDYHYNVAVTPTPAVHYVSAPQHEQPIHYQSAAPVHHQYGHGAPVANKAVHYSPAEEVSHASFQGLGTQYKW